MVIKNEKRLRTGDGKKSQKLGTFGGVFLPTALNVLSILMFLRFGFVVGQMGILGSLLLLFMSYAIDLLTTLSISAIATNGTVRGGGAYYMISRSLGPEFGGSIGIVFYIGQILNSALNVVGFIEPLLVNFGVKNGEFLKILPDEGYWWVFLYSTVLLFLCTIISLTGSGLVSKAGSLFFGVLIIATISIPISTLFVAPFEIPELDSYYSGPCIKNLKENLMPHFTKKAAGSQIDGKETFNDLFGIFFPAAAGIFAGASMSGDLKKPSKAIPKGTLYGLLLTFLCYFSVILSIGIAIPRDLLYKDVHVIQSINISRKLVLLGEFSTALFSVIVGIVGAANVLEAIAKDEIIPGLKCFNNNDNTSSKASILFTWLLTQLCLFADINQIATFITMAFLMTFIVTNLACFLLKIGSAPNFRPSFDWFSSATAFVGCISCAVAMFIVDGTSAMLVIVFLLLLFLLIHYVCPPKAWGDVSQSLIYHQVRKYLLRLRQDNVKYWRPQILLLMDNPRTAWNLMSFCNHLKKGGLYILGHVIVTETFQDRFSEFKKQQQAWMKLRDLSKIKAFVQIGLGPTLSWGVRNVYLGSGLGGMKPNITVLGFYDLSDYYAEREAKDSSFSNPMKSLCTERQNTRFNNQIGVDFESLPTDSCRNENKATIQEWVHIIEDLLLLESNVAIAKGFPRLISVIAIAVAAAAAAVVVVVMVVIVPGSESLSDTKSSESDKSDESDMFVFAISDCSNFEVLILTDNPNFCNFEKVYLLFFISSIFSQSFKIETIIISNRNIHGQRSFKFLVNFYNLQNTSSFFAAPPSDNSYSITGNASTISLKSRKQARPNFSSVAIPQSQVLEDASGDQPSIMFIPDLERDNRSRASSLRYQPSINNKIANNNTEEDLRINSPGLLPSIQTNSDIEGNEEDVDYERNEDESINAVGGARGAGADYDYDNDGNDCDELSFNEISAKAQHLILNDLMLRISSGSGVIFSTLPAPSIGCHKSEEDCLEYVQNLNLWCSELPPILLINSQSMTVTTAL
ncbi:hypothetical protein PACTADRAFT_41471 [Pachysolen tannophilus NRRL Y-2460]|uniref:Amino acid permease/ SLC12A domain-containing protein n=1 Tax=Pachysolen tannophilus NRRL Y-2460 TaxID=669874 RepID=A0A1E4TX63_PACTA|nr:hypothetical protein PACTADRAFT_41471 [Pachysolen tannophilus NRRL Y-2460]